MKISRAGVWTLVIMLLVIPFMADLAAAVIFRLRSPGGRLYLYFYKVYLIILPVYIVYVIVANAIIKQWDKWKKY